MESFWLPLKQYQLKINFDATCTDHKGQVDIGVVIKDLIQIMLIIARAKIKSLISLKEDHSQISLLGFQLSESLGIKKIVMEGDKCSFLWYE